MEAQKDNNSTKERIFELIFGTETTAGRNFDVILLWLIVLSTIVVMLESITGLRDAYGDWFMWAEYAFTFVFTIEYVLRLWTARKPIGYATSFYGIIDLLSILPTYLALVITSSQYLMVIRIFRLMRVFRVLKVARFMNEADSLWNSLKASRAKIGVFLFAVMNVAVIMGTIMYIVEGGEHGFTSIPRSIYWAVVTMTTVGFGDIHPTTDLGQFFSLILMIMGYGIIAVPTGIVGVEMVKSGTPNPPVRAPNVVRTHCDNCGLSGHIEGSNYCRNCGAQLNT